MWLCSSRKNLMDDWQKYVEVAFPLSAHTRHIGTSHVWGTSGRPLDLPWQPVGGPRHVSPEGPGGVWKKPPPHPSRKPLLIHLCTIHQPVVVAKRHILCMGPVQALWMVLSSRHMQSITVVPVGPAVHWIQVPYTPLVIPLQSPHPPWARCPYTPGLTPTTTTPPWGGTVTWPRKHRKY